MIPSLKKITIKGLRFLLYPIHKRYVRLNGYEKQAARMELPNNVLLSAVRDAIKEGHTATIIVKGWSMRPFLEHKRDKVLIDTPDGARKYDAVLAEIAPGTFVLHRIIDIKPNTQDCALDEITLMGDGNIKGTEHCLRKDICGIVTHYIRPNRTIAAYTPNLVRNIRLWARLLPIRRVLLVIYKSII